MIRNLIAAVLVLPVRGRFDLDRANRGPSLPRRPE